VHVVISVVVNEVGVKCVKRSREMKSVREVSRAIHRREQGTTSNAINMNHCKMFMTILAITHELGLDHPLPMLEVSCAPQREQQRASAELSGPWEL